jgi:hypothetical protein
MVLTNVIATLSVPLLEHCQQCTFSFTRTQDPANKSTEDASYFKTRTLDPTQPKYRILTGIRGRVLRVKLTGDRRESLGKLSQPNK